MQSVPRLALTSTLILILLAPPLAGCASGPLIVGAQSACSELIPSSFRAPVPGADLPAVGATAGELWIFADAQTAQLDKANGRTADVLEIVERCESRDRATLRRLQAPFWLRIFRGAP